jgi:RNA recognition motif-containing protein
VLFVGNLPFEVEDDDFLGIFSEFEVLSARVVKYRERSKGYGFVTFKNEDGATKAKAEFEGAVLEGRDLEIKWAYAEEKRSNIL